jgi:hypothetical protein
VVVASIEEWMSVARVPVRLRSGQALRCAAGAQVRPAPGAPRVFFQGSRLKAADASTARSRDQYVFRRTPRDQNVFCCTPGWIMIGAVFEGKDAIVSELPTEAGTSSAPTPKTVVAGAFESK